MTLDIDVLLDLHVKQIGRLLEMFPEEEFYVPPAEVIHMEIARRHRGHMNLYHHASGMRADIYIASHDPLDTWSLANAIVMEVPGGSLTVVPPETVIIRKLEYFREGQSEKHVRDIQTILGIQRSLLHRALMEQWIAERGLTKEWRIVLEAAE